MSHFRGYVFSEYDPSEPDSYESWLELHSFDEQFVLTSSRGSKVFRCLSDDSEDQTLVRRVGASLPVDGHSARTSISRKSRKILVDTDDFSSPMLFERFMDSTCLQTRFTSIAFVTSSSPRENETRSSNIEKLIELLLKLSPQEMHFIACEVPAAFLLSEAAYSLQSSLTSLNISHQTDELISYSLLPNLLKSFRNLQKLTFLVQEGATQEIIEEVGTVLKGNSVLTSLHLDLNGIVSKSFFEGLKSASELSTVQFDHFPSHKSTKEDYLSYYALFISCAPSLRFIGINGVTNELISITLLILGRKKRPCGISFSNSHSNMIFSSIDQMLFKAASGNLTLNGLALEGILPENPDNSTQLSFIFDRKNSINSKLRFLSMERANFNLEQCAIMANTSSPHLEYISFRRSTFQDPNCIVSFMEKSNAQEIDIRNCGLTQDINFLHSLGSSLRLCNAKQSKILLGKFESANSLGELLNSFLCLSQDPGAVIGEAPNAFLEFVDFCLDRSAQFEKESNILDLLRAFSKELEELQLVRELYTRDAASLKPRRKMQRVEVEQVKTEHKRENGAWLSARLEPTIRFRSQNIK